MVFELQIITTTNIEPKSDSVIHYTVQCRPTFSRHLEISPRMIFNLSIVNGVFHSTTQADVKLLASKEGMSGLGPGAVIVTLRTSSILVATRSCRHRFDALEVDEQVDCADDCTQRCDDDQSQHSRRHYSRRRCCWRTCRDVIGHVTVETNHRQRRRRRRHCPVS